MKTLRLLFIISLFNNGVFGDTGEVETVLLKEGDYLTLHTGLTDIQPDDVILWSFEGDLIAQINKADNRTFPFRPWDLPRSHAYKELNPKTGDLTLPGFPGLYKLQIDSKSVEKSFKVSAETGGMKTVSVMEGDSLTLHTNVPDVKKYDVIRWVFQDGNAPLAEINRKAGNFSTHDDVLDGRFRDRLQLDNQIDSLTIRNIRAKHSGRYIVDISSSTHTIHQSFTVTVIGEVETVLVMEGDTVTLHTDTHIQTDDLIQWRFGPDDTRIAEIYKPDSLFTTYDGDDGKFRDRLKLNNQTGDLTITDTRTEDTGVYKLKIRSRRRSIQGRFNVIVSDVTKKVKEGGSVTLHADRKLLRDDVIVEWRFKGVCVAQINRAANKTTIYDDVLDGRFRGRLKVDDQTGSLTITNITAEQSGDFKLYVKDKTGKTVYEKTVKIVQGDTDKGKTVSVIEGDSVTLHTDLTGIQMDYVIEWSYERVCIAQINGATNKCNTSDDDLNGRFRDRLKLNYQHGSLTITNFRAQHTGVYQLHVRDKTGKTVSEKTLKVVSTGAGVSSDVIAGICFGVFTAVAAAVAAGVILYHCWMSEQKKLQVRVNERESVPLQTGGEIQRGDQIQWISPDNITLVTGENGNGNERFRDRVEMNHQTISPSQTLERQMLENTH